MNASIVASVASRTARGLLQALAITSAGRARVDGRTARDQRSAVKNNIPG
jgi:hypothetical protein